MKKIGSYIIRTPTIFLLIGVALLVFHYFFRTPPENPFDISNGLPILDQRSYGVGKELSWSKIFGWMFVGLGIAMWLVDLFFHLATKSQKRRRL